MNKKYAGILGIVIAIVVVTLLFVLKPGNDEKLINDFLHTWFEKSEDNQKLAALFESPENNAVIMGEGVDEETLVASLEASEKTAKEFQNIYGKYFTNSAFKKFVGVDYWNTYDIHTNSKKCKVSKANILKDNSAYKFEIILDVDGKEIKKEGRIELQNGKIDSLKIY